MSVALSLLAALVASSAPGRSLHAPSLGADAGTPGPATLASPSRSTSDGAASPAPSDAPASSDSTTDASGETTAFGEASGWEKRVEATGYLVSRTSFSRSRFWGPIPTDELPQLQQLFELNAQLKVSARARSYAFLDLSLVGGLARDYRSVDGQGREVALDDRDSPYARPVASINELYALHEFLPELSLTVGKKRVVWGSGLAHNPTDFWNPRRDPTDPTAQRSGAYLALLEVPLPELTFSFFFAPALLKQQSGIPTHFFVWPDWDRQDGAEHWQLGARGYALVGDADVNVMVFFGHRYADEFERKLRVGLSFTRYFFTDYELHAEALLQSGSPRDFLEPDCFETFLHATSCAATLRPFSTNKLINDSTVLPRVLVGARRQFDDESMLSLEYLWQADGWTRQDFATLAKGLSMVAEARGLGLPVSRVPALGALMGGTSADGVPARLSFEPRGQHYLFVSYQKPRIRDDFTAQLTLMASLTDGSTLWTPAVAWSATEWLTLNLLGFVPVAGPDAWAPKLANGRPASEYGVLPFTYRVMFEARAYY